MFVFSFYLFILILFYLFSTTFAPKINNRYMRRIVLGLFAAIAVCSCSEKKSASTRLQENVSKAPTRVMTELVGGQESQTSNLQSHASVPYVGIVEEREATAVSFTGMGVVKRVLVNEGQTVSRGQLIAEMDDTQARNLLSGAEASMAQANDALQRYGLLHDNGSLPEVQWVEIQSKVAQAKSQLEVARKNLADCRLVAPVSGIIGRKQIGAGETALPSQAVVTILDISTVKVKVSVPEAEVSGITANTSSIIKVDAISRSFEGGRVEKGVQADAMTHTYDIRIHVANGDRKLLPGMVASVQFVAVPQQQTEQTEQAGQTVMLPVTAVQKKSVNTGLQADGSLFVWTVNSDSTAHRTAVTIGETIGNRIVVTTGVKQGQRIVTEGYQKLSEGTKVIF